MSLFFTVILLATVGGIIGGFIAVFLIWLVFWRPREPVPSEYLEPGQMQPLSAFAGLIVKYVLPNLVITKGDNVTPKQRLSSTAIGEDDRLICKHPEYLRPETTSAISILIIRGEMAIDFGEDEPASIHALRRDEYGHFVGRTEGVIETEGAETNVNIVPRYKGKNFSVFPSKHIVDWVGETRKVTFYVATGKRQTQPLKISFRLMDGVIVRAELNLNIEVSPGVSEPQQTVTTASPYRQVFVSYSHDDKKIIDRYVKARKKLGNYIRDRDFAKQGEKWEPQIKWKIAECDKFQLFWSNRSMRSEEVKAEWDFAFDLNRDRFVRPTFWERPFPADQDKDLPPEHLSELHFEFISETRTGRWHLFAIFTALALFMPKTVKAASAVILLGGIFMGSVSGLVIHDYFTPARQFEIPRIDLPKPDIPTPIVRYPDPSPLPARPLNIGDDAFELKDQKVWGQVLDDHNKPVANATVWLSGGPDRVNTNAEGRFELNLAGMKLRPQTKMDITVKVNGREKTIQVETPGRLNFRVTPKGDIEADFLWLPYFDVLQQSCDDCCTADNCMIYFMFQNFGAPARSVRALLRVPNTILVHKITVKDVSQNPAEHSKKFWLSRSLEKTHELVIELGNVGSDPSSKDFVPGIRVYFHARKDCATCLSETGVKMQGYVFSFIDRRGRRRRLPDSRFDEDVYSACKCEDVKVTVREYMREDVEVRVREYRSGRSKKKKRQ